MRASIRVTVSLAVFAIRTVRPRRPAALGDATRLRALRLIAEPTRSTEELATMVGLSESGRSMFS